MQSCKKRRESEERSGAKTKQTLPMQSLSLSQVQLSQNDALSKPSAQQVFQKSNKSQVSPLFDHFSQKFSPLLAHAHIKPKICLNLPLKSGYAMNVVQSV